MGAPQAVQGGQGTPALVDEFKGMEPVFGTSKERAAQVRQVRVELHAMHRLHGRYVTDLQVANLFAVVGDAGVCADALALWPRPGWVERLVGPYPPNLELSNPEDVAGVEEWGASGTGT